jgi:hypothetical protein
VPGEDPFPGAASLELPPRLLAHAQSQLLIIQQALQAYSQLLLVTSAEEQAGEPDRVPSMLSV